MGHGGLHSPPRCLCPPLTPPSHRPAAIYHSWDWSELEMWRGWGVASLFNHPQLQHTHTHTHTSPPLIAPSRHTHSPFSHAPTTPLPPPSHLLSLNNRCCFKIKEECVHVCVCVWNGFQPAHRAVKKYTCHQLMHIQTHAVV